MKTAIVTIGITIIIIGIIAGLNSQDSTTNMGTWEQNNYSLEVRRFISKDLDHADLVWAAKYNQKCFVTRLRNLKKLDQKFYQIDNPDPVSVQMHTIVVDMLNTAYTQYDVDQIIVLAEKQKNNAKNALQRNSAYASKSNQNEEESKIQRKFEKYMENVRIWDFEQSMLDNGFCKTAEGFTNTNQSGTQLYEIWEGNYRGYHVMCEWIWADGNIGNHNYRVTVS